MNFVAQLDAHGKFLFLLDKATGLRVPCETLRSSRMDVGVPMSVSASEESEMMLDDTSPERPVQQLRCTYCDLPQDHQGGCSRCNAPYCSPLCQRAHWAAQHRLECGRRNNMFSSSARK
jgi:hypothetical protein